MVGIAAWPDPILMPPSGLASSARFLFDATELELELELELEAPAEPELEEGNGTKTLPLHECI